MRSEDTEGLSTRYDKAEQTVTSVREDVQERLVNGKQISVVYRICWREL